jgi:hypothetical protein
VLYELEAVPAEIPHIHPAFRWAQSLDNVFIEIKFAKRLDSPGCLDVFDEKVYMDRDYFNISAYCRVDKVIMYYTLELELFDDIVVEESTHGLSSVGRYAFNL